LALDAVGRRRRWLAVLLAVLTLGNAWIEAEFAGRQPRGDYRLPENPGARELAELPGEGAVLDLPPQPNLVNHLRYQLVQIRHGRPVRFHHLLGHLQSSGGGDSVDRLPMVAWFRELMHGRGAERGDFTADEIAGLRAAGFGFVVLHKHGWPEHRWRRAQALLLSSLGEPVIQQSSAWICWRLPGADEGETRDGQAAVDR